MACPLCGDECHCSYVPPRAEREHSRASFSRQEITSDDYGDSEEQFAAGVADDQQLAAATAAALGTTGIEREMAEEESLNDQAERWRDEVADRVNSYKRKRSKSRLSGEFSMRFDFPADMAPSPQADDSPYPQHTYAASPYATAAAPAPTFDEPHLSSHVDQVTEAYCAPEAPEAPVAQPPEPAPEPTRARRRATLIEFPRFSFMGDATPDQLAEPLLDKPRILDVPEDIVEPVEPAPLADLKLDDGSEEELDIEIPLQVAPLALRAVAAAVDLGLVLSATAVFGVIAWTLCHGFPQHKLILAAAVLVPCVLWLVYEYLFLVYGGATIGMKMWGLQLRTFDNEIPIRNSRRGRALTMALSGMAMGLGFFWAVADQDALCWHDRISRTYLTN